MWLTPLTPSPPPLAMRRAGNPRPYSKARHTMTSANTQLLTAGVWRDGADAAKIDAKNPDTGEEIGTVAHATRADPIRLLPLPKPVRGFGA